MRFLILFLTTLLLLTISLHSKSENSNEIKQLHDQQCSGCHINITDGDGLVIYTRSARMANSLQELESLVKHFADGSGAQWDQTQIKQVTDYLNQNYYGFVEKNE